MDLSEIYDIRVENETQIIVCKSVKPNRKNVGM